MNELLYSNCTASAVTASSTPVTVILPFTAVKLSITAVIRI